MRLYALNLARLEKLIGIEAWFNRTRPRALILRPLGFIVVEEPRIERCNDVIHIVSKFNVDTRSALQLLGARGCSVAGLKDSEALTSQHVSCKSSRVMTWSRGSRSACIVPTSARGCLRPGRVRLNHFSITVATREPQQPLERAPNYYGFQRFGTRRPNSHILGLYLLSRLPGHVIDEMLRYRYPWERGELGDYEERVLRLLEKYHEVGRALTVVGKNLATLLVNAYQSYLFNRLLSRLVAELGERVCNEIPRIPVPGCGFRRSAARLGTPRIVVDYYEDILAEEGVKEDMFCRYRIGAPPRETCLKPLAPKMIIMEGCEPSNITCATYTFALKGGGYATVYLAAHYELLEPYTNPLAYEFTQHVL